MSTAPIKEPASLALVDGTVYHGASFGAEGESVGEVVFNTSMTGYQEILTDPSYSRQIVTMTYPLIGNYGANADDIESVKPHVEGFVVREYCSYPSSWRNQFDLADFLRRHNIVGIEEVDTRALTRRIRTLGAMNGVITTGDEFSDDDLVDKARDCENMDGLDGVRLVSSAEISTWTEPTYDVIEGSLSPLVDGRFNVVAYDFGVKQNILRLLVEHECRVTIVPGDTPAKTVLEMKPDGVFLSNGPGDPSAPKYAIEAVRKLYEHCQKTRLPIFGICLGHQILGLAMGGDRFKLKFGHRGGNQPVKDLSTGVVEITSQNHGFGIDADSLGPDIEVTHINLNDQTVEGLRHKTLPIFSVQYHPEASPGPHDARYLFGRFIDMMAAIN